MSKIDFVAKFPQSVPVATVIERAKAAGVTLGREQVHRIRWAIRNRAAKQPGKQSASRRASIATPAGRATRKAATTRGPYTARVQLRQLILQTGLDTASSVIDELRVAARSVLG